MHRLKTNTEGAYVRAQMGSRANATYVSSAGGLWPRRRISQRSSAYEYSIQIYRPSMMHACIEQLGVCACLRTSALRQQGAAGVLCSFQRQLAVLRGLCSAEAYEPQDNARRSTRSYQIIYMLMLAYKLCLACCGTAIWSGLAIHDDVCVVLVHHLMVHVYRSSMIY